MVPGPGDPGDLRHQTFLCGPLSRLTLPDLSGHHHRPGIAAGFPLVSWPDLWLPGGWPPFRGPPLQLPGLVAGKRPDDFRSPADRSALASPWPAIARRVQPAVPEPVRPHPLPLGPGIQPDG